MAWNVIQKRIHEVHRVSIAKSDYSDLILTGVVHATLKEGNVVVTEFVARIVFQGDTKTNPKASLYQVSIESLNFHNL